MNITQNAIIQGSIKGVGLANKSEFTYTYEIDKEILHVYDTLKHNSTSAINCIEEVISLLEDTLQPNKSGVSKILEIIKNTISPRSPFKKVIIYTEVNDFGYHTSNKGQNINVCAFNPNSNDFTGWTETQVYQLYCDNVKQEA